MGRSVLRLASLRGPRGCDQSVPVGPRDAIHQAFHRVVLRAPRARHRRVQGADAARGGARRAGDAAPVPARRHRRVRRAGPSRARLRPRRRGREGARVRGDRPHGRRHGRGVPRGDCRLYLDDSRPEPAREHRRPLSGDGFAHRVGAFPAGRGRPCGRGARRVLPGRLQREREGTHQADGRGPAHSVGRGARGRRGGGGRQRQNSRRADAGVRRAGPRLVARDGGERGGRAGRGAVRGRAAGHRGRVRGERYELYDGALPAEVAERALALEADHAVA